MIARTNWTQQDISRLRKGLLFISPWIIGFLVFVLYPLIYSLVMSFARYSGLQPPVWLGWQNYTRLFQPKNRPEQGSRSSQPKQFLLMNLHY